MVHLEEHISAATAPVARIAELVAALPSRTVEAPRTLQPVLLDRLEQIGAHHGGEVPLHGRLFSQWMHHAYPLECPFPHEAGTINPQTVDEWLRDSGHATEQTSDEERQRIMDGDVCAVNWEGKVECGEEPIDLPWDLAEELISGPEQPQSSGSSFVLTCIGVVVVGVFAVVTVQGNREAIASKKLDVRQVVNSKSGGVLAVLLLATSAFLAGLLDGSVFAFAFVGSLIFYVSSIRSAQGRGKDYLLPKHVKFVA